MTGFTPGFASRHDAAAAALKTAFGEVRTFQPVDITAFAIAPGEARGFAPTPREDFAAAARDEGGPRHFSPAGEGGPRHFTPRDPDSDPTAGWDPFDATASTPESDSFVDPIAAAHAAGYAEGVAATLAQAAADAGRDRAFGEALSEALGGACAFDRERVARQLRETVLTLVARLVGEAGVAPELLAGRIASAVDLLADTTESALLRMNPEDVPLVEGRLPKTLFPVGDATVARGSFVLESASTIVEDGPGQWLDQLTQAIDRVAVPAAC